MIQASGVVVRRGKRRVVNDVSFAVPKGSWLVIVGPNGAGKTTLLRVLAGLCAFDGLVSLGGVAMADMSIRERSKVVSLVAQDPLIPPGMSVVEYVLLGRTAHLGRLGRESARDLDAVGEALRRLDLDGLHDRVLATLSGGECQRACIARALVQQTPLLLLDEPTAGLDLRHQVDVLELIDELRRERNLTVVSTLHDLTLSAQFGDSVLVLDDGCLVADGAPHAVFTPENLQRLFGGRVRVLEDNGQLLIVPART
jgi:iron complex transport system ATP-binding protein